MLLHIQTYTRVNVRIDLTARLVFFLAGGHLRFTGTFEWVVKITLVNIPCHQALVDPSAPIQRQNPIGPTKKVITRALNTTAVGV